MSRVNRSRSRWNVQYYQRVLALDPIAYYPLDEKQGTVAYDWVTARDGGANNGVHVATALGYPGIGDGRTCPFFDGVNAYVNLLASGLPAAWNGPEFSVSLWAKVFEEADWDPAANLTMYTLADAGFNNLSTMYIWAGGDDHVYTSRRGSGVEEAPNKDNVTTLDWMHWTVTSSEANDRCRLYHDGVQAGADEVGLGAWAGVPNSAFVIGANDAVPVVPWHGYLAHFAFYSRELTPAQIVYLARRS